MHDPLNRRILLALRNGVDPHDGTTLPPSHVCQSVDVVRALFAAVDAIERDVAPAARRALRHSDQAAAANAGGRGGAAVAPSVHPGAARTDADLSDAPTDVVDGAGAVATARDAEHGTGSHGTVAHGTVAHGTVAHGTVAHGTVAHGSAGPGAGSGAGSGAGRMPAPCAKPRPAPANAGQPWTDHDDRALVEAFDGGATVAELCDALGRSRGSVRARLMRLGRGDLLEPGPAPRWPVDRRAGRPSAEGASSASVPAGPGPAGASGADAAAPVERPARPSDPSGSSDASGRGDRGVAAGVSGEPGDPAEPGIEPLGAGVHESVPVLMPEDTAL